MVQTIKNDLRTATHIDYFDVLLNFIECFQNVQHNPIGLFNVIQ